MSETRTISFLRIEVFAMSKFFKKLANIDYFDLILVFAAPMFPCWVAAYPLAGRLPTWVVNLCMFVFNLCSVPTVAFVLFVLGESILMYRATHAEEQDDINI